MTDLAALDALIEAVTAGTLTHIGQEWRLASMPRNTWEPIVKANSGSLDAAHALHEALLPGWDYGVGRDRRVCGAVVAHGLTRKEFEAESETPARAWLLATLKAYRASL